MVVGENLRVFDVQKAEKRGTKLLLAGTTRIWGWEGLPASNRLVRCWKIIYADNLVGRDLLLHHTLWIVAVETLTANSLVYVCQGTWLLGRITK